MTLYEKYSSLFTKYGVVTKLDKAYFMAQTEHESHLKPISENLNYSSDSLVKVFPKYFNKTTAVNYHRNPQKIANVIYANRMGNGNTESGDGWKYRGRGFIQLTGKENYLKLSKYTGIDFVNNPDLLLQEENALIAALWFWKTKGISALANTDNIEAVTKRINGGLIGLDDRKKLLAVWKSKLL